MRSFQIDDRKTLKEWGQAVEICKGSHLEGLYVDVLKIYKC